MCFQTQLKKLMLFCALPVLFIFVFPLISDTCLFSQDDKDTITLPAPEIKGTFSLEEAINKRRSVRNFSSKALTIAQISQLLWSAQGITQKEYGFRAVPSAGATYPLEIYIVTQNGLMHYLPKTHSLEVISKEDLRKNLTAQAAVASAAMDVVICAEYERVEKKYKDKGERYAYIEAGHTAQNIHLTAVSLGLGSLSVGGFDDTKVQKILQLDKNIKPLYIIPVGAIGE